MSDAAGAQSRPRRGLPGAESSRPGLSDQATAGPGRGPVGGPASAGPVAGPGRAVGRWEAGLL